MRKCFILFFLFSNCFAFAQSIHSLRFVYIGRQLKPIGTVVISVEKLIQPTDKVTDNEFGKAFQTDLKTFKFIERLCKKYKIVDEDISKLNLSFNVIDGRKRFLLKKESLMSFKNELKSEIKNHSLDIKILEAFVYFPWE